MKKSIIIISSILILVLSLVVLTGCENKSSKPIVGSWEYTTGGYVYTFKDDGTGSYAYGTANREFTYEDDGTKVKITYNGDTTGSTYEYKIEGKKLIIKDNLGNDVEYNKK